MMKMVSMALVLGLTVSMSGCAAFRASVEEKDPQAASTLTARYDQNDLLTWGKLIAEDIESHPFVKKAAEKPIVVNMGIQNRTKTHMDMKAITDTITTALLDTGSIRLINAARRDDLLQEQGYQLHNCPDDKRVQIGKQLGAGYMLTGSLVEIEQESGRQVRVSKQQDVYYQLTVELTDLETGEIALRKQRDRLRRASKPLIGW